jgi:hypothetical protein
MRLGLQERPSLLRNLPERASFDFSVARLGFDTDYAQLTTSP